MNMIAVGAKRLFKRSCDIHPNCTREHCVVCEIVSIEILVDLFVRNALRFHVLEGSNIK